ncbi:transposase [Tautonia plasticadhaerens]|uniref:Insertion element IS402-like domain-containing protein n=1 Tax=Tautonia plasticadhaerens TaxID=2527974 RepID=A0A518H1G3_9BACT|nr:transposase [Tautonia plasticadhaerens]QDV34673.1 hypothetical protein ElP_25670 [Tautonia plasticadhaerens]
MAALVTDELWRAIAPHLPPPPPSPKGGRPRVEDRQALAGILFVLREGLRWRSPPAESGCGSGSTRGRRFAEWTAAGVWDRAHAHLLAALGERGLLDLERCALDSASTRAVEGGRTPQEGGVSGRDACSGFVGDLLDGIVLGGDGFGANQVVVEGRDGGEVPVDGRGGEGPGQSLRPPAGNLAQEGE